MRLGIDPKPGNLPMRRVWRYRDKKKKKERKEGKKMAEMTYLFSNFQER